MYLLGEPRFNVRWRATFFAPSGNRSNHLPVLGESTDMSVVAYQLRGEYLAIAEALYRMGEEFWLICSDLEVIDERVALVLNQTLGCKLAGFAGFSSLGTLYPRDLCTVFPKVTLLNDSLARLLANEREGKRFFTSPFGEGGRVLYTPTTALVGSVIMGDAGTLRLTTDADVLPLRNGGVLVGKLPLYESETFSFSGDIQGVHPGDHLDRIACLLRDGKDRSHLFLDQNVRFIRWPHGETYTTLTSEESWEIAKGVCCSLGITLHCSPPLCVPYALNVLQTKGKKVLMTSGEPELENQIGEVVGRKNVFTTAIPVRFYPVWSYAGIRCLVNELPVEAMRKV